MTWARVKDAFEPSTCSRIVVSGRGAGGGADDTSAEGAVLKPQAHQGSCTVAAARAPATAIPSAVTAKSVRAAALKNVCGIMMLSTLVARGVARKCTFELSGTPNSTKLVQMSEGTSDRRPLF